MDAQELLTDAKDRIRDVRTAEVRLHLVNTDGRPISNAAVDVQLTKHAFKFGCNSFGIRSIADPDLQAAYEARFAALLNYATLPFYWGGYESTQGVTREAHLHTMASWCAEQDIVTKGHPLVWHEVFPQWAHALADDEVLTLLETRVKTIPAQFRGQVDIWDVVNEATVSHRFDNAVGRWAVHGGAAILVEKALRWARAANPEATLLYNDFNISPEFEQVVADLLNRDAPVDVIGIQSHMHQGTWSLERAWTVCEAYARFGLPLHFTELTVLSGRLKPKDETDWHQRHTDWDSTPEGEAAQAEYGEQLYTLLFSHPAVEAITWWDFADYNAWQNAPAGFLRTDMSPKPFYDRLMALIHGEWRTDVQTTSDATGALRGRCFFGEHAVTVTLASGDVLRGTFALNREDKNPLTVVVRV
jgi:endo-1,4-beta-xylanase